MDRAGLTPAYAVEVQHKRDHAQQEATEAAFRDPQDLPMDILRALPKVVGCLPREEVEGVKRFRLDNLFGTTLESRRTRMVCLASSARHCCGLGPLNQRSRDRGSIRSILRPVAVVVVILTQSPVLNCSSKSIGPANSGGKT